MDCPECHTWNPDDRLRCWRCNATLPAPEPPKKRRINRQTWIWIVFIVLFLLSILIRCAVIGIDAVDPGAEGVGWLWGSVL